MSGQAVRTSAANVAEGQEVRIGGRWVVCSGVEHKHAPDGSVATVTLWLEECPRSFWAEEELTVWAI